MTFFDYVTGSSILIALAALVVINKYDDKYTLAKALKTASIPLELLGLALSVFWAVTAPSGSILPIVFVIGFVGMLVGRAALIPLLAQAVAAAQWARVMTICSALIAAYFVLYISGGFHGMNDAGDAAQSRLESSKPAQALDAEIAAARLRIGELATFSDATKAHNEQQQAKAAQANQAIQAQKLKSERAAIQAKLNKCPKNYFVNCIDEKVARIAVINTVLDSLGGAFGSDYAARNTEYTGLQLHLVALQKQRAALSENGGGITSQWKQQDIWLADLLDTTPQHASRLIWLIAVFFFDLISLLFRASAAIMTPQNDPETNERRKLNGLLGSGLSVGETLAIMTGANSAAHGIPNAQVQRTEAPAKLDVGGFILSDGLIHGHKNECVLCEGARHGIDAVAAGFLVAANKAKGMPEGWMLKKITDKTDKTARYKGGVFQCTECGNDYTARHKNHYQCSDCSSTQKKDFKHKHC